MIIFFLFQEVVSLRTTTICVTCLPAAPRIVDTVSTTLSTSINAREPRKRPRRRNCYSCLGVQIQQR